MARTAESFNAEDFALRQISETGRQRASAMRAELLAEVSHMMPPLTAGDVVSDIRDDLASARSAVAGFATGVIKATLTSAVGTTLITDSNPELVQKYFRPNELPEARKLAAVNVKMNANSLAEIGLEQIRKDIAAAKPILDHGRNYPYQRQGNLQDQMSRMKTASKGLRAYSVQALTKDGRYDPYPPSLINTVAPAMVTDRTRKASAEMYAALHDYRSDRLTISKSRVAAAAGALEQYNLNAPDALNKLTPENMRNVALYRNELKLAMMQGRMEQRLLKGGLTGHVGLNGIPREEAELRQVAKAARKALKDGDVQAQQKLMNKLELITHVNRNPEIQAKYNDAKWAFAIESVFERADKLKINISAESLAARLKQGEYRAKPKDAAVAMAGLVEGAATDGELRNDTISAERAKAIADVTAYREALDAGESLETVKGLRDTAGQSLFDLDSSGIEGQEIIDAHAPGDRALKDAVHETYLRELEQKIDQSDQELAENKLASDQAEDVANWRFDPSNETLKALADAAQTERDDPYGFEPWDQSRVEQIEIAEGQETIEANALTEDHAIEEINIEDLTNTLAKDRGMVEEYKNLQAEPSTPAQFESNRDDLVKAAWAVDAYRKTLNAPEPDNAATRKAGAEAAKSLCVLAPADIDRIVGRHESTMLPELLDNGQDKGLRGSLEMAFEFGLDKASVREAPQPIKAVEATPTVERLPPAPAPVLAAPQAWAANLRRNEAALKTELEGTTEIAPTTEIDPTEDEVKLK